jgi:regulator of replication initiation timing
MVYRSLEKIGLDGQHYSVHKLRHTAATLTYQYGDVDVLVLKEMLGHENLSTTEIYTHLENKQLREDISDFIEQTNELRTENAKLRDQLSRNDEIDESSSDEITQLEKLEEKIKLINNQIKTLDDANNNYYLNKEYYTNIKNLLDTPVDIPEIEENCNCGCDSGECKCKDKNTTTLKDIYDMSPEELARYLNKRKIFTLADLVEYFLKNY